MSIVFFVFNLLPIYPLDGFRVLDVFNKKHGKIYQFLRFYGIYVLYFFVFLGIVADYTGFNKLDVLGNFLNLVSGYLSYPITAFWGLIF